MKEVTAQERVNWRAVAFYYTVACALSWPFFWWRDVHPESWFGWRFPGVSPSSPLTFILKNAVVMWGPGTAALLSFVVFRHAWFDIVFTFPNTRTYIALSLSIIFWIFLLWRLRDGGSRGEDQTHSLVSSV